MKIKTIFFAFLFAMECFTINSLAKDLEEKPRASDNTYSISTQGSTQKLKPNETGTFIINITTTQTGVSIKKEAPFKLIIQANNLTVSQQKYAFKDGKKEKDTLSFAIPYSASQKGNASLKADLDFFVCSEQWCEKRKETVVFSVTVE